MTARRFYVSGRVQGVFFRASTRAEAARLAIEGYARNLQDGRVEVLAMGSEESVAELALWLESGPPAAKVREVIEGPVDPAETVSGQGFICS